MTYWIIFNVTQISGFSWRDILELLGQTYHSTCNSGSRITSFLRFWVFSLTEIILILVNYNRSTDDGILSKQWYNFIFEANVRISKWVSDQVTKIPNMPLFIKRTPVTFIIRVKMRTSRCTAFRQISKLMNMYSMLTVGIETFCHNGNFNWAWHWLLAKWSDATHVGIIGVEDTDSMSFSWRPGWLDWLIERYRWCSD